MGYGLKTIFQTKLTEVSATDLEGVGTLRQEGENFYRWVEYSVNSLAGQPMCYAISNGSAYHQKVTTAATAHLNTFAGISMAAATAASTKYGWIQIDGYCSSILMSLSDTSVAAGFLLWPANAASYLVYQSARSDGLAYTIASAATNAVQTVTLNQYNLHCGFVQLAASKASTATVNTAAVVTGFVHCLLV
jgi:hypothetical protein